MPGRSVNMSASVPGEKTCGAPPPNSCPEPIVVADELFSGQQYPFFKSYFQLSLHSVIYWAEFDLISGLFFIFYWNK